MTIHRMKLVPALILGTLAILLLAGCSSGSKPSSAASVAVVSGGGSTASAATSGPPTCLSLVGKPVIATQGCSVNGAVFTSPGSNGCYPAAGAQQGSFYYFENDSATILGKDGGAWQSGPGNMSVSDMAGKLGC